MPPILVNCFVSFLSLVCFAEQFAQQQMAAQALLVKIIQFCYLRLSAVANDHAANCKYQPHVFSTFSTHCNYLASKFYLEKLTAFSISAMGSYLDMVGESNHSETGESSPKSKTWTNMLESTQTHVCGTCVHTHKSLWEGTLPCVGVSHTNLCPIFVQSLSFD